MNAINEICLIEQIIVIVQVLGNDITLKFAIGYRISLKGGFSQAMIKDGITIVDLPFHFIVISNASIIDGRRGFISILNAYSVIEADIEIGVILLVLVLPNVGIAALIQNRCSGLLDVLGTHGRMGSDQHHHG